MSLRLLVDESADSRRLRRLLASAGHDAVLPVDFGLGGATDADLFAYAQQHGLVVLTKNPADFRRLHEGSPEHSGIFLVYDDNDSTRDMTDAEIVRAIGNLVASGIPIAGEVHALNHWRY